MRLLKENFIEERQASVVFRNMEQIKRKHNKDKIKYLLGKGLVMATNSPR
jgi:hypothetical protein